MNINLTKLITNLTDEIKIDDEVTIDDKLLENTDIKKRENRFRPLTA